MFFDIALTYDPSTRRCDLAVGDDGDLVIDETSITPVLLSIGLDRRASPDDPLPQSRSAFLTSSFAERRGWAGDALDLRGERVGSRLWLLDRAKETETTRMLFQFWLEEALAWVQAETGSPAELDVSWVSPQTLGYRILVDDAALSISGAS